MMIHRLQENESVLKNFHALSELIRSRSVGYFYGFTEPASIGMQEIMAANVFAVHLNKSSLEIEDIHEVVLDYKDSGYQFEAVLGVIHHDNEVDHWCNIPIEDGKVAKLGFDVLKHSIKKAAESRQPAAYKIEQGLLRTSNGGDMWDGIVDLDAYDHFWWDEFTLKANGRYSNEALVCLHLPSRPQDPQFKEKMLEDIFQAMKEMKPCVKK